VPPEEIVSKPPELTVAPFAGTSMKPA